MDYIENKQTKIYCGDCLTILKTFDAQSIDIFITSPPYNLNIKYNAYKDNLTTIKYLEWLNEVFIEIKRVLKDSGSFFLNIGSSNIDPWVYMDVANVARPLFILQNDITWVKSISINNVTYGHFKPINSKRFMNNTYEHIFQFTKIGTIEINRKSIGVPYTDKSNVNRWNSKEDMRCKGNTWFIPYNTIQSKGDRGNHPASFPEELVKSCIKLQGYNKDTIVCDPFCGSGTTLKVTKDMGIYGVGIELDDKYVDYIVKRIS